MIALQILLILFAFFMVYVVRIHFQKKNIGSAEYYFWLLIWLAFMLLVIRPSTISGIAQTLRVSRVFDLLLLVALMFLTLLTFFNRIQLHQMQRKLERFVREKAIEKGKEKKGA